MMWYSVEIDDKQMLKRIMDAFMPKYIGAGRPVDMAVFQSVDKQSGTNTVYFSPKASSLALQFGAQPFDGKFVDVELSLLVGDQTAIDALFPDADKKS